MSMHKYVQQGDFIPHINYLYYNYAACINICLCIYYECIYSCYKIYMNMDKR